MIKIITGVVIGITVILNLTATVLNFKARVKLQKEMKRLNQIIRNKDSIIDNLKKELEPNRNVVFRIKDNIDPEELKKNYEQLQAKCLGLRKLNNKLITKNEQLEKMVVDMNNDNKVKDIIIKNKEEMAESLNKTLKELKPDLKVREIVDISNK